MNLELLVLSFAGYSAVEQLALDPDRNDRPLEFNRPLARLSAEQAFKQDIERTKAVLSTRAEAASGRPFNSGAGLLDTPRHFEEVRERHALPLQFGKNAVKKTPREIEEERRRSAEVNRSTAMDRNAGNFGGVKSPAKNFLGVGSVKDRSGIEKDFGNMRAFREDVLSQRGAANVMGAQRGKPFIGGQPKSILKKPQPQQHADALEYDQWGRKQEQSRNREQDAARAQVGSAWKGGHERQELYEYGQENPHANLYAEAESDYRRNEQRRSGGASGLRASQEYSAHAELAGDQQFGGYFGAKAVKKQPYEARESFQGAEADFGYNYGEYEEQDYAAGTGFENVSAGYSGRGGLGATRPAGRGGLSAQAREMRGGLLANKGGRALTARGAGALAARGGRGNVESTRGRGALGLRGADRGRPAAGGGRGLLPMPKELEDAYYGQGSDETYAEEAGAKFGHFQQQVARARMLAHGVQQHALTGQRSGINFY